MIKIFKYFLWLLAAVFLTLIIYLGINFPPVMSGTVAKTMCSCVYGLGRSPESVLEKELTVFPGLNRATIEFMDSSSVTATLLWSTSKAIYRKGLGCTLLAERTEQEVRNQNIILAVPPLVDQDTIPWPMGNMKTDSLPTGVNYEMIESAIEEAFLETNPDKPKNTRAVVVVYKGQIIGEKLAPGFNINSKFIGWSMTKSITNALTGILVKEGKLTLEQPAPVPEWQNDERKNILITDLLHSSSGLDWKESYSFPGHFHNMFTLSDDKGGYAAAQKLAYKPNKFFEYSSGTANLLSKIIRQTVGDPDYYRFPYEKFFYKIGMYHALIEPDASGTFVGSSYGYASARDWARFGLLYLNDGMWNGERILPEGWVKYSSTPAPAAPIGQYGALFWLNAGSRNDPSLSYHPGLPNDEYGAEGFEDQFVFIIPSRQLVVVRLGVSHHGSDMVGLTQKIINALPEK